MDIEIISLDNEVKFITSKKNGKQYTLVELYICDGVKHTVWLPPAEGQLLRNLYNK